MSNPFLASALVYATRYKWPVFPLKPREKVPATLHGLLDATTDETQIRAWWDENPEYNLAIRTGDGLVVIDGDRRKNGHLTLRDLIRKHGSWTTTYKVLTSDGCHFYFKSDVHLMSRPDSLGPGVDVKGQGGYVVAPPSIHPSGHLYQYDAESQSRPAPLPEWVTQVADAYKESRLDRGRVLAGLPVGERDMGLFRYASLLRSIDFPLDLATEIVLALAARCVPPFPREIAAAKVESAYQRYAPGASVRVTPMRKARVYE